jgi:RNA polymerase sigma-70 factor (ECF subfamily)
VDYTSAVATATSRNRRFPSGDRRIRGNHGSARTMRTSSGISTEPGSGPDDLLLVRQAVRGDPRAVEEVVSRLSCIVRFVFRLNRKLGYALPTESLEDVVQQVYASIWPRLRDFAGSAALESWAFGFCRNCLRAEVRRRSSRLRLLPTEPWDADVAEGVETELEPEQGMIQDEGLDALRDELDRLDADERLVVEMRHFEGRSFEQIARVLDLPASTVKDRCYRALTRMRRRLRRRDVSA